MTEDFLELRFLPDAEEFGKLLAQVRVGDFAGAGAAWFGVHRIDAFAESLCSYPLPATEPLTLAGGYGRKKKRDQENLAIVAYPVASRGQIGVQVRIATELQRGDRRSSQAAVQVELLTTYESLRRFANQLRLLAHGEVDSAVLKAERL
jgi:hypothetical protein